MGGATKKQAAQKQRRNQKKVKEVMSNCAVDAEDVFYAKCSEDAGYIKNFLLFQPMMTYAGWLGQKMPVGAAKLALFFMWMIEILAPFALFVTGYPRQIAAAAVVALQLGIQMGGNFGHFNLLSAVLCIPMFDAGSAMSFSADELVPSFQHSQLAGHGVGVMVQTWLSSLVALVVLIGGVIYFAFNSCVFSVVIFSYPLEQSPLILLRHLQQPL